jgi:hypothetical protein
MAPTGTRMGDWVYTGDRHRVRLIADLDGDGQDELLVSSQAGIAILKMVGRSLISLAVHRVGINLGGYILTSHDNFALAGCFRAGCGDEILVSNQHGLHTLVLDGNRLQRRAFVANGTRVDGWVVNTQTDALVLGGNLTGAGTAEFVIRSPWGIGVMSVGPDHRFRCHTLHRHGAALGDWPLESSDIIAGAGEFVELGRAQLLVLKQRAGSRAEPRFESTRFENWHRNVRRTLPTVRPANLAELVNAVRLIQSRGQLAGVAGSGWSFTECVLGNRTQALIDTSDLNMTLGGLLPDILDDRTGETGRRLVHVEAGVKLYDLNCRLDRLGLALPTLGGSRGQSLAGVLSTGVHGADVSLPPVADMVRAVHLVGPGGQQWWIEPATRSLTTRDLLDRAKARGILDPSIRTVYDDQWFNAVLVAMGCAGVIYSVIVECWPAYRLRSTTTEETWAQAQQRISDLALPDRRPRYLEINVSPADRNCRVTVRNETADPERMPTAVTSPPIGVILAGLGLIGPGALGLFLGAVGAYIARTTAEIAALNLIPGGQILAAKKTAEALRPVQDAHRLLIGLGLAAVDPHNSRRVAEILPTAINLLWTIGAFVIEGRALVDHMQREMTRRVRPEGTLVGSSFRIMSGQPSCARDGSQTHDETERLIEGFEYAVPVSRSITFVDRLLAVVAAQRKGPDALVVNLNLRFTARTRATLGMQQFDQTCHVEVYTIRDLRGNSAFKEKMSEVVREFEAVPHWGQFHAPNEAHAFQRMGALQRWQQVVRSLAGGNEMFWSDFARVRGLLP